MERARSSAARFACACTDDDTGCGSRSRKEEVSAKPIVFNTSWSTALQTEWRVACVRIPRFPIGAMLRAQERGVGKGDVQLLLPMGTSGGCSSTADSRTEDGGGRIENENGR